MPSLAATTKTTMSVTLAPRARISEKAFTFLDAPVVRVAAFDSPTPFAPTLERAVLPNAGGIADAPLVVGLAHGEVLPVVQLQLVAGGGAQVLDIVQQAADLRLVQRTGFQSG